MSTSEAKDDLQFREPVIDTGALQGSAISEDSAGVQEDQIVNAMSIDVEEYFQVSAFANCIGPEDWDQYPSRVEKGVDVALRLFDEAGVRATFFVLGWVAERHESMIRRIATEGHEIASHGYAHAKVTTQTMSEFREDVVRTKGLLEDIGGQSVKGYRAPSFSIGASNLEALDILAETGHKYSSSIYPIRHDHYGMPEAPRFAFKPGSTDFLEIPMSTFDAFGRNFPCGGGGYFRLSPYSLFRWAVRRLNEKDGRSSIFYFHPWELDPSQPQVTGASRKARFRHSVNLRQTERDLARLLSDFRWDRMDRVFLDQCP